MKYVRYIAFGLATALALGSGMYASKSTSRIASMKAGLSSAATKLGLKKPTPIAAPSAPAPQVAVPRKVTLGNMPLPPAPPAPSAPKPTPPPFKPPTAAEQARLAAASKATPTAPAAKQQAAAAAKQIDDGKKFTVITKQPAPSAPVQPPVAPASAPAKLGGISGQATTVKSLANLPKAPTAPTPALKSPTVVPEYTRPSTVLTPPGRLPVGVSNSSLGASASTLSTTNLQKGAVIRPPAPPGFQKPATAATAPASAPAATTTLSKLRSMNLPTPPPAPAPASAPPAPTSAPWSSASAPSTGIKSGVSIGQKGVVSAPTSEPQLPSGRPVAPSGARAQLLARPINESAAAPVMPEGRPVAPSGARAQALSKPMIPSAIPTAKNNFTSPTNSVGDFARRSSNAGSNAQPVNPATQEARRNSIVGISSPATTTTTTRQGVQFAPGTSAGTEVKPTRVGYTQEQAEKLSAERTAKAQERAAEVAGFR